MANQLLDFLDIELTERCNHHCIHCYIRRSADDRRARIEEIDFALICSVVRQATELGCTKVRFTGGEPLIRPDFGSIYSYAYDLGLSVSVATNATLITPKLLDVFATCPPSCLSVSIYGWDAHSYEAVTRSLGSFTRFLHAVARLRDAELPVLLRYPPLRHLVANSERIRDLAEKLGASYPVPYSWELTLNAWHQRPANRRLSALRLSPKEAAVERLKEPGVAQQHREKLLRAQSRSKNCDLFGCPAARLRPTVNAYGQLQVCLQVRHPDTLYDLRTGTLSHAVTEFFPKLRKWRNTDSQFTARCRQCLLRPICGQCPAIAWMAHGTLGTPSQYYCDVTHEEARLLGLIGDAEMGWELASLKDGRRTDPAEQGAAPDRYSAALHSDR